MVLLTQPDRVSALYKEAGYTLETFAATIMEAPTALQRWENFEDVPTLIELGMIANALHVSKRALCFGNRELRVNKRGEPYLDESDIESVLDEGAATQEERTAFSEYRARVDSDHRYSRTFVLVFTRAWRAARTSGYDPEHAMRRAMVIATQAHWLSRAVAQGVRPVREHQHSRPPKHLGRNEQLEWIAADLHRLANIKPPIEAMVLAVALGQRLVPTLDDDEARD